MGNVNKASLDKITIVEYNNSYAKSIAKMWELSGDNWGGGNAAPTETDIIEEHENTDNMNIYLAVDNEEVVGYCSFGEYKYDQGALYIPLLNVRPDYHGKKVGKKLVLKTVERTIDLGWPRLDLFTWPGNTKAVPLYKKTGFFWEKRDDATHLMNFIPTVVNVEALKEYFEDIDWYEDSIRPIEIKPDGDEESDYENYEYLWQKDNKRLRVEFERKGRGIRLIETPDYLIEVILEDSKLIFGNKYKAQYHMINKTGKPLNVTIKGLDDKNIKFSMDESINVESQNTITGVFEVQEIEEEQNNFKTHPAVVAEMSINGKKVVFKAGIEPLFPAKISISTQSSEKYINTSSQCFLNLQNNFNEDVVFKLALPNSRDIEFSNGDLEVSMKAKERKSIAIPCILHKPCLYSTKVDIEAITENGSITFSRQLSGVFKGNTGAFGGETEEHWVVCNGKYTLRLSKFDNEVEINTFSNKTFETLLLGPKLGMPLSGEFSKKKPHGVQYLIEGNDITLKAIYSSSDFKNIQMTAFFTLSPNGITKHYHEVTNLGDTKTEKQIWVRRSFFHNLANSFIPYENEIIQNTDCNAAGIDYWDSSRLSENWIFSKDVDLSRGICWSNDSKVKFMGWHMAIDDNLGCIDSKQTVASEPMYIALDTFSDYKEFRSFALKNNVNKDLKIADKFDISINKGNPFVGDSFEIEVKNHHKINFNGNITAKSLIEGFSKMTKIFKKDEEIRESILRMSDYKSSQMDIIELDVDLEDVAFKRQSAVFNISNHKAKMEMKQEQGMEVLSLDNGSIIMKAAPEFGPALYSITYKNKEWLHNSFPTAKPLSWWNPWTGGIMCTPENMQMASVINEESLCEFVELKDNFNNLWQGIKVTLDIKKHEDYKGLQINQYFMTISDLPIILTTTEIIQNTGYYFDSKEFYIEMFIKPEDELKDNWFTSKNSQGGHVKYKGGTRFDIKESHVLNFGGRNIEDSLTVYHTGDKILHGTANNLIIGNIVYNNISCESGKRVITPPTFLLFNDQYVDEKVLKNLKNIKLNI